MGTNVCLTAILAEAKKLGVLEHLEENKYPIINRSGKIHLVERNRGVCGFQVNEKDKVETMDLTAIKDSRDKCKACFASLHKSVSYQRENPWSLLHIIGHVLTQKKQVEALSTTSRENILALTKLHLESGYDAGYISSSRPLRKQHPVVRQYAWSELTKVRERAAERLASQEVRDLLLEEARQRVRKELPDERLLAWRISLGQVLRYNQSKVLGAVLLSHNVQENSEKGVTYVIVPAVIGEWVGTMVGSGQRNTFTLHQATSPGDAETVKTAVALWENEAGKILSDLNRAADAAKAVHAA